MIWLLLLLIGVCVYFAIEERRKDLALHLESDIDRFIRDNAWYREACQRAWEEHLRKKQLEEGS